MNLSRVCDLCVAPCVASVFRCFEEDTLGLAGVSIESAEEYLAALCYDEVLYETD